MEGKVGWDSRHSSNNNDILFSGDITAAPKPHGATEVFYIKDVLRNENLLCMNYFNYNENIPVTAKLFVAKESISNLPSNYMVNPNNILMQTYVDIDKKQYILGLITKVDGKLRFYFSISAQGNSNSIYGGEVSDYTRRFLSASTKNTIDLEMVLKAAGALVVTESVEGCIDLSPTALTKTSILDILQ